MLVLTAKGEILHDALTLLSKEDSLPEKSCPICVPLERWLANRQALQQWDASVALSLQGDSNIKVILADIPAFPMIVITFEHFKDGRGYSLARLLREHHGYSHRLLAQGDILEDQVTFMIRCGFDGFLLPDKTDTAPLRRAIEGAISVCFQPTNRQKDWVIHQRHHSIKTLKSD